MIQRGQLVSRINDFEQFSYIDPKKIGKRVQIFEDFIGFLQLEKPYNLALGSPMYNVSASSVQK